MNQVKVHYFDGRELYFKRNVPYKKLYGMTLTEAKKIAKKINDLPRPGWMIPVKSGESGYNQDGWKVEYTIYLVNIAGTFTLKKITVFL